MRRTTPFAHIVVLIAFIINTFGPVPARAEALNLPKPGVMIHLSPELTPAHLVGMSIHPDNALRFDFLINRGDDILSDSQKKEQYTKLVKYFLASLTVPDQDQWVNLSPYEKDRIIKDDFGKTEMGRDLLAQDYILKQITSSLIYPEEKLGKKFWDKVYKQAWEQFHTTNIPVNTFNKVWIIPDEAAVYESGNTVYVLRNHLKVMLEEDYMSLQKHITAPTDTHAIGSQIVREVILPELEREVNEGKNFAPLRKIYSGMILATWYKHALKESLLGKVYANKAKVKGVDQDNPKANEEIYQQYLKAFKKGVFNYIKEDVDKYSKETLPRKYFSGGTEGFSGISAAMAEGFKPRTVLDINDKNIAQLPASVRASLGEDYAQGADQTDSAMVDLTSSNTTPTAAMKGDIDRLPIEQLQNVFLAGMRAHPLDQNVILRWQELADSNKKSAAGIVFLVKNSDGKWCMAFAPRGSKAKDKKGEFSFVVGGVKENKRAGTREISLAESKLLKERGILADFDDSNGNAETPLEAAINEAREEAGVDLDPSKIVASVVHEGNSPRNLIRYFFIPIESIESLHPNGEWGNNREEISLVPLSTILNTQPGAVGKSVEESIGSGVGLMRGIKNEQGGTLEQVQNILTDGMDSLSAAMQAPSVWDRWSKELTVNFKSKSEGSITFRIFVPDDQKMNMLEKGGSVLVEARTSKGILIARYETTKRNMPIEAVEETIKDVDGYFQRESYNLIPFNSRDFLTSLDRYLTSMPFIQYRAGGYEVRFKKVFTPAVGIIKQSGKEPLFKASAAMSRKTFTRLMAVFLVIDAMVGGYLWNKYSDNGPRATPVSSEEKEDPLFPTIERVNLIPAAVSVSKIFDEKKLLQEANKLINKFPDFFKGNHKIRNVADLYPYATDFTAFYSDENHDLYDRNVAFAAVLHSFMDSNDKGGKEQYNQYTLSMLLNSKYDLRRSGALDDVEERADALARIMSNLTFNLNDSESIQWIKTPAVQKEIEHLLGSIPEKEGLLRKHLDYLYYSLAKQMSEDGKSQSEYMDMIHLFNADNVPFLLNEWVNFKDVLKAGLFDKDIFQVIPWLKDPSVLDYMKEFDGLYKVDDVKNLEYKHKKNVYRYLLLKALAFKKEGHGLNEFSQFMHKITSWGIIHPLSFDDISLIERLIDSRRIFEQMLQEGRKDPSRQYVTYFAGTNDYNGALFNNEKALDDLSTMYGKNFLYMDIDSFEDMLNFIEKVRNSTGPLLSIMINEHMNPTVIEFKKTIIFAPFIDIDPKYTTGAVVIKNKDVKLLEKRLAGILDARGNVWLLGCSSGGVEIDIANLELIVPGHGKKIFDFLVMHKVLDEDGIQIERDDAKLSDILNRMDKLKSEQIKEIKGVITGAKARMNNLDIFSRIFGVTVYGYSNPIYGFELKDGELSFLSNYAGQVVEGDYEGKKSREVVRVIRLPKLQPSATKKPTPAPQKFILKKFRPSNIIPNASKAMMAFPYLRTNGGIDMNSANLNLQIKRDGKGVPLPLAQQDMFKLNSIAGFVPVIIDIKPAADLPIFSELQQKFRPASIVLASAA